MSPRMMICAAALVAAAIVPAGAEKPCTDCLAYDTLVTLAGTVIVRKVDFGPDEPAWFSGSFPLLILDHSIGAAGSGDDPETSVWAIQLVDTCRRTWPPTARVRVTGKLFHATTIHNHTAVLIDAKQIQRLDGKLPACKGGGK